MDQSIKKRTLHRLKILGGQIKGLQKMVEDEKYCIDIVHQSQAIKEALSSVEALMLENHLNTHVQEQIKKGKSAKTVKEMLSIYRFANKK